MRPPSGNSSSSSLSCGIMSGGFSTRMPFRNTAESLRTATVIVFCSSFFSLVLPAMGSLTSTPFCSIGVITMKMMSSTIMMSAMGVTLMSATGPPFLPPTAIAIGDPSASSAASGLGGLLDEVVEQLGAGVVHLDAEAVDLAREIVVGPDRGHRHEQTECRGDEGLGDAGRDRGDAARAGERHARERVDDAEGGAEEAHEGGGGADRGQARQPALQVREVDCGGALDGALGGVDGSLLVALGLAHLLLVLPLLQADHQHLGQVRVLRAGPVGGVDGFLDLALLQEARDLGCVPPGLLGGLLVREPALDHHANRVDGHDRQDHDNAPGNPAHVLGHRLQVELHRASSWTVRLSSS